jgi:hypothetical protein
MEDAVRVLLALHFLGLAMGFSAGFGSMVMAGLMAKCPDSDRRVLATFPPAIAKIGDLGLVLLWLSGLTLVFVKWQGFGNIPPLFHAKLTAVVVMTLVIGYGHSLRRKVAAGDPAATARMQMLGKVIFSLAILIVLLAVWTFN